MSILWFFVLVSMYFSCVFQEPEVEICASMLDALNECIQVCDIHLSGWNIVTAVLLLEINYYSKGHNIQSFVPFVK